MELTTQPEKAYLKQNQIFLGNKRLLLQKDADKHETLTDEERRKIRYWKNVGLGFETPRAAIEGEYIDKKCPFTGNVSIRGRILRGVVKSAGKMQRTIVVRRDFLRYRKKYKRYEKHHTNIPTHCSPAFDVHEGDQVIIGQCRPLSKTVRFNVLKVIPRGKKSFIEY